MTGKLTPGRRHQQGPGDGLDLLQGGWWASGPRPHWLPGGGGAAPSHRPGQAAGLAQHRSYSHQGPGDTGRLAGAGSLYIDTGVRGTYKTSSCNYMK